MHVYIHVVFVTTYVHKSKVSVDVYMQEFMKLLGELEGQLEELDGWGQLLTKDCVKPDGEVIQGRVEDLRLALSYSYGVWFTQSAAEQKVNSMFQNAVHLENYFTM